MNSNRLSSAILFLLFICLSVDSPAQRSFSQSGNAATSAQAPKSPQLSEETAFLYSLAIAGTPPSEAVERYASYFDAVNDSRAMADEFERRLYLTRMTSTLTDLIDKVDFSARFTFEGSATFGEYSFEKHEFPLVEFPQGHFLVSLPGVAHRRAGGSYDLLACHYFRARDAVNKNEFSWSIPMAEAEASALVKERTSRPGVINRRVTVRITYSVMSWMIGVHATPIATAFAPYIHSIEIYGDESRTRELAALTATPGTPITAYLPDTRQAAQSATTVVGEYQYRAGCRDNQCQTPILGIITLTDVGLELSGEQVDGSANPTTRGFVDAFAVNRLGEATTRLWRANSGNATWDYEDFRVVWRPFENAQHEARLIFATMRERDRFFVDLTAALEAWTGKYPQFVFVKLDIDDRCQDLGNHFGPCSQSDPSDSTEAVEQASPEADQAASIFPDPPDIAPLSPGLGALTKFGIRNRTFRPIQVFMDGSTTPIEVRVNYQSRLAVGSTHTIRVVVGNQTFQAQFTVPRVMRDIRVTTRGIEIQ